MSLLLKEEAVKLDIQPKNAIEAIEISGKLLVNNGFATEDYIDAMIKNYTEIGPYIVVAPGIAIPHARPDQGALDTGLSLLRIKEPIQFGHEKNDPVQIICAITGIGDNGHLEILQKVASILGDSNKYEQILRAQNYNELSQIINNQE